MTYIATPKHKRPCSGDHEIYNFDRPILGHFYNFDRPVLGHFYCILSLFDLCLGVKKRILKEIMHFHCMTYMAYPSTRAPAPEVMKLTFLVDPSFGHYYHILNLFDLCLGVEKKIF